MPVGGVASGRVCACSLRSKLVIKKCNFEKQGKDDDHDVDDYEDNDGVDIIFFCFIIIIKKKLMTIMMMLMLMLLLMKIMLMMKMIFKVIIKTMMIMMTTKPF